MNLDDPKACTCDNIQLDDYQNVHNNSVDAEVRGSLFKYYMADGFGGNMYPSSFPIRCQACGENVILPDGTKGKWPCFPDGSGEDWFTPGNVTAHPELITQHQMGFNNYTMTHGDGGRPGLPYWWVKGWESNSKCPRAVDCPDWRYEKEPAYSRQMKLLKSVAKVLDLAKVSIGFETLGTDELIQ